MKTQCIPISNASSHPDVDRFDRLIKQDYPYIFLSDEPVYQVRVPGRLDLMGGIADYSGSLVCEMPIRQAVVLGIQKRRDSSIHIHSLTNESTDSSSHAHFTLDDFFANGAPRSVQALQTVFKSNAATSWSGYALGALPTLVKNAAIPFPTHGFTLAFQSDIPMGGGVSSSAALEVAAMLAWAAMYQVEVEGIQLATWAQHVENAIVGAPCGIMDQLSVTLGKSDACLIIKCQPADIQGYARIPSELNVMGIHTQVKHSVGGSRYTDTRIGAFMGRRIILDYLRPTLKSSSLHSDSYLAELTPQEYSTYYKANLPVSMIGKKFLAAYGTHKDSATLIDPTVEYKIRSRTEHPIYENHRVQTFVDGLNQTSHPLIMKQLGKAMYGSHYSYRRCGMSCREADFLVHHLRPVSGVVGARITGGGCGGTVALVYQTDSDVESTSLPAILADYEETFGFKPACLKGSSPGGLDFGFRKKWFST